MTKNNKLLFINEYGIYPELVKRLQETQYSVTVEHLMRNAIKFIKKQNPSVVVAEFFHEPQFRDRVSNLESMLAQIEGRHTETRTVVFYNPKHQEYLDKLLNVFSVDAILVQPFEPQQLIDAIETLGTVNK
jgi:AmiR/NasT family two-component response regulator